MQWQSRAPTSHGWPPLSPRTPRRSTSCSTRIETSGAVIRTPESGYLQFIRHRTLVRIATEADAVIRLPYRPGHFLVEGRELASVWPPEAADRVAHYLSRAQATGPHRTLTQDVAFGVDQLVEIAIRALSPAVNDTFTALTCVDWLGDCLCKIAPVWTPTQVHRDRHGSVHPCHLRPGQLRTFGPARLREGTSGQPRNAGGDDSPTRRTDHDHGADDRSETRCGPDGASGDDPTGEHRIGSRRIRSRRRRSAIRGAQSHP